MFNLPWKTHFLRDPSPSPVCSKELSAELRLLSVIKAACKVGFWLTSKTLAFQIRFPNKNGSLCLNCANHMVYAEHLLSSCKSGVPLCSGQRCHCDQLAQKPWPLSFQGASPVESISHLISGVIKCILCDSLGKDSCKFAPGFLWTSAYVPFPFADFALYPFAIINQSPQYNRCWVLWVLLASHWT